MSKIFAFLAGAAIGIAVTAAYYRAEYDRVAAEVEEEPGGSESNEADAPNEPEESKSAARSNLYRITGLDFGEESDYTTGTLFYFNNGVLTDSDKNVIDIHCNIKDMLTSQEIATGLIDGCGDTLFLRDDKEKIDYEVLMVDEDFEDNKRAAAT